MGWSDGPTVVHSPERVCYTGPQSMTPLRSYPDWWDWELIFTGHAEARMEQRGVSETDIRSMLVRATGLEASAAEGRFMVRTRHQNGSWVVILEPDSATSVVVVVTAFENVP